MNLPAGVSAGHDERCEYGYQMDFESHPLPWRGPKSHLPGGTILRRTAGGHNNDHSGEASLNCDLPSYCMQSIYQMCKEQCLSVLRLRDFKPTQWHLGVTFPENCKPTIWPFCKIPIFLADGPSLALTGVKCGKAFKFWLCLPATLWHLEALRTGQNRRVGRFLAYKATVAVYGQYLEHWWL